MKSIIRIPTRDQYAFVEFHTEGTPDEIQSIYDKEYQRYNTDPIGTFGGREWQALLDRYLENKNSLHSEEYQGLSQNQKAFIQELKRAFARIENRYAGKNKEDQL